MEPYESIYVGNFIFTLGYLTKEKGIELRSQGASLMAQNVGDEVIADLISGWKGKNFVIEFKRNEKSIKTEFAKSHKKELIRRLNDEQYSFAKSLAHKGHFIGFGDFEPNEQITGLSFSQYHEIKNTEIQTAKRLSLSKFIFNIIMKKDWGLSDKELGEYIDILASAFTSSDSGGSSGAGANVKSKKIKNRLKKIQDMSSLIINYNEDTSEINFVACNLSMARELTLEPTLEVKHGKRREQSSKFTFGK